MRRLHLRLDSVALLCSLTTATRLLHLPSAASSHALFVSLGIPFSLPARNAAIDAYAKCGRFADAKKLFDETPAPNVVTWTALLSGALHCIGLESAQKMFDVMPAKNHVSWTIMAAAYVEHARPREALRLLSDMLAAGHGLSHVTCTTLLSRCAQIGDLAVGQWVHNHVLKTGNLDEHTGTALVDMYGKCGRIITARRMFERLPQRTLVSWNVMMGALSLHGQGIEALQLLERMVGKDSGFSPDKITFIGLLSACAQSGLVDEGCRVFRELEPVYGMTATIEHYACIVDLLGRTGKIEEAEAVVKDMVVKPNEVVLGALVASCSIHGEVGIGKKTMQELVNMFPSNVECHVMAANLCSRMGCYGDARQLRKAMRMKRAAKSPGVSAVEICGQVHWFTAGDLSHPEMASIYSVLEEVERMGRAVEIWG